MGWFENWFGHAVTNAELEVEKSRRDAADARAARMELDLGLLERTCAAQEKKIAELTQSNHPQVEAVLEEAADRPQASAIYWSSVYHGRDELLTHQSHRLFSDPISALNSTKREPLDIGDTNIKQAGCLPQHVQVTAIVVELLGGAEEDARQIRESGTLAFEFTQFLLDIGPLGAILLSPSGRRGVFKFGPEGVVIQKGQVFGLLLRYGRYDRALAETIRVRVSLFCKLG